ncbi:MAG: putative baseplate assembly protein, partial [Desulfobacterales bacterium]|nr:putative baseplate assembly protein [Desulfobacterales bacterium]
MMGPRYECDIRARRRLVLEKTGLNGVDYLEVVDKGPGDEERQRVLKVFFLKEDHVAGLKEENIRITGGERIREIAVRDVSTSAGSRSCLIVRLHRPGDFSTYRLSLVDAYDPLHSPNGFDPILSGIDFSFKVGCAGWFDAPDRAESAPAPGAPPPIDYLSKDFASFRGLMLDRMAAVLPDWKERNVADVGVAIVEVLAYAADYLSYYQDAAGAEAYLGTARKRISVKRHARLLDYRLHEGCNARCRVCVEVDRDYSPRGPDNAPVLPRGAMLLTRVEGEDPVVYSDRLPEILRRGPLVFETMHPVDELKKSRNWIPFYTWGEASCHLPKGATRAALAGDNEALGLKRGDVLIFEEMIDWR